MPRMLYPEYNYAEITEILHQFERNVDKRVVWGKYEDILESDKDEDITAEDED